MSISMKTAYLCDHEKNTKCKKSGCFFVKGNKFRDCFSTFDEEFACIDENGEPIIVFCISNGKLMVNDEMIDKYLKEAEE